MNFKNDHHPKALPEKALIDSVMGRRMFPLPRFVAVQTPYLKEIYRLLNQEGSEVKFIKGAALGPTESEFHQSWVEVNGMQISNAQWIAMCPDLIKA